MSKSQSRILFVSYTADLTGPTKSLLLLLKHLRDRYRVAVLLPGQGLLLDALASEHIPFFSFSSLTKWSIPAVVRLIRRERFALVYGNNHSSSSRNALVAAKLTGIPFVCHIREMIRERGWRQIGYLRFAQAAIAVSNACADSLVQFVPDGRLHVVYNGVQLSTDPINRQVARAHLLAETGLAPEHVIIVSMAHITPRKGQSYGVQAMGNIVKKNRSPRLLLVGGLDRDTEYVKEIRLMIQRMGLEQHVFLLGFQKNSMRLLEGADLLLHTSVGDPHPRSVIEGMAANLPVVAFAIDGVAETVVDGQTGYLVPRGDVAQLAEKIQSLATAPKLRAQMGRAGRQRVEERFSADRTAEDVAGVVDRLLN